jgi:hypothetical protein
MPSKTVYTVRNITTCHWRVRVTVALLCRHLHIASFYHAMPYHVFAVRASTGDKATV